MPGYSESVIDTGSKDSGNFRETESILAQDDPPVKEFEFEQYYDQSGYKDSNYDYMMMRNTLCNNNGTQNGSEILCNDTFTLPDYLQFNEASLISVIVYTCLFIVAATGNLTVFITLFRNRHRKSRVNMFIMHLSLADLIVTFVMFPLEIGWNITVAWTAGDGGCRVLMFFRAFGFYLSSFILVAISLDRYFAILHPLSLNDADRRGKMMLIIGWIFSFCASIPQSVIFHTEAHPVYPQFIQCVTFNFFSSYAEELVYNFFNMMAVYGVPLIVIIVSYGAILIEMFKKARECKAETSSETISCSSAYSRNGCSRLRRSTTGRIERARLRTLKMTIVIVSAFIVSWTPYFVFSIWWWTDSKSAETLHPDVQRGLFLFAMSNTCMDPIVYGFFALNFKKELGLCCEKMLGRRQASFRERYDGIQKWQTDTRSTGIQLNNLCYLKDFTRSNLKLHNGMKTDSTLLDSVDSEERSNTTTTSGTLDSV